MVLPGEPIERDLPGRATVLLANLFQRFYDRHHLVEVPKRPAPASNAAGLRRIGPVLTRERTLGERAVGDEGDVQLPAGSKHAIRFRAACEQVVVHLVRNKRHSPPGQGGMRPAHLSLVVVAHAYVTHLPRFNGVGHAIHERRDAQKRPRPMHLVKVDRLELEAGKTAVQRFWQLRRSHPVRERGELGSDEHGASGLLSQPPYDLLRLSASIHFRGIDERYASIKGGLPGFAGIAWTRYRVELPHPLVAPRPSTEPQRAQFDAGRPKVN